MVLDQVKGELDFLRFTVISAIVDIITGIAEFLVYSPIIFVDELVEIAVIGVQGEGLRSVDLVFCLVDFTHFLLHISQKVHSGEPPSKNQSEPC